MADTPNSDAHPFDALVQIMATLRGPDGCPWDRDQTLDSLRGYLIEESYEVLDALGDPRDHQEELGDLLLQIVFQARIRNEEGHFDAYDVCRAISNKMVRRHPHVFGDQRIEGAAAAFDSWERIKADERGDKPVAERSALQGVPRGLPALLRAHRYAEKASSLGFDWPDVQGVLDKVAEERAELDQARWQEDPAAIRHEVGDLLQATANLARHLGVNPEDALQEANDRFAERFGGVERGAAEDGVDLRDLDIDELERRWQRVKQQIANPGTAAAPDPH